MIRPGRQNYIFAVKTFGAAMLALYLAFALDLSRPSWAMLTVFIVSQPFAGMVASKAVYRVAGTITGAVAAGFMLIVFTGAPELQALALASWVGLCIYIACLERSPRAYAFLLAGYTAAFIGFPTVGTPAAIFDTAIARCEEIILAILCVTVIHGVVLPQRAGPVLSRKIDDWFASAAHWLGLLVGPPDEDARGAHDHRRLIGESGDIERLRIHALYDTPELKGSAGAISRLQAHMQSILSLLLAIDDRLAALRAERPDIVERLRRRRETFFAWLRPIAEGRASPAESETLLAALDELRPADDEIRADRHELLLAALIERLRDLVTVWNASIACRDSVKSGRPVRERAPARVLHADYLLAAASGLTATVAISLCCAFWIGTAWPEGYLAAMLAAVGCSLAATFDDAAGFLVKFLYGTLVGMFVAGVYLFGVLPALSGFPMLTFALAPVYLLLCTMLGMPAYMPIALPILLSITAMLALTNAMTYDFAAFVNLSLAQIFGVAVAAAVLSVARASRIPRTIHRIVAAIHRDLGRIARDDRRLSREDFESVMLDRIEGLIQRRAFGGKIDMQIDGALASIRVGLNLIALRADARGLEPAHARLLAPVFAALATHFSPASENPVASYDAVGVALDESMAEMTQAGTEAAIPVLIGLSSLRRIMRDHADFFRAPPASGIPLARFWSGPRVHRTSGGMA
jgi:uncharacterized membrane protein YccC